MHPLLLHLPVLLVHAVTLTPDNVPAKGLQDTILTLDQPGMVRLGARSSAGTQCDVVDHIRGPFASSGQAGKHNCQTDLLLDAGSYKVRLHNPSKGKGKVALSAVPFAEVNQPLTRLVPGRVVETQLPDGKQASYWITVDEKRSVALRVAGRTAGLVKLWRNGEWMEEQGLDGTLQQPNPGQGIHEWWMDGALEPGDYLLTVYGTDAAHWTKGTDSDALTVQYGLPEAPTEGGALVTLPASGLVTLRLPLQANLGFMAVHGTPRLNTSLSIAHIDASGAGVTRLQDSCSVAPKALNPECTVRVGSSSNALVVRGVPGTQVELGWATWTADGSMGDGVFAGVSQRLNFSVPESGSYMVVAQDLPADRDSAPLSCVIMDNGSNPVAWDMVSLSPGKPFERAFNYNHSGETVWFDVQEWGRYRITTGGERKNRCEVFQWKNDKAERVTDSPPDATTCDVTKMLTAGRYILKFYGGTEGIERLRMAKEGVIFNSEPTGDTAAKGACTFQGAQLKGRTPYSIRFNRGGNASARGIYLRALPLALNESLPVQLEPAQEVRLPVTPGRALQVRSVGGVPFECALASGPKADGSSGVCTLPATVAPDMLVLTNKGKAGLMVRAVRPETVVVSPPLQAYAPVIKPLPTLQPGKPVFMDFGRDDSHSLLFDVTEAGLYHVTTEGLLSTRCTMRTPLVHGMADASGGGRGRNCLVAGYLRPGRYLLTVRTQGQSRGRAAVVMGRRPLNVINGVTADGESFFRADAGDLIQQKLTVKRGGRYSLSTTAQGAQLSCRLDDPQGWPVVAVPTPCDKAEWLDSGTYLWTQLPLTVESMRRTELKRVRDAVVLTGNKPHTIALNTSYNAILGKDGKDEFFFDLLADADINVELNSLMQGRIYNMENAKNPRAVEVIAPQGEDPNAQAEEEAPAYQPEEAPPEYEGGGEGEEGGEPGVSEGDEEAPPSYRARATPVPQARPQAVLRGQRVTLPAGHYKLVTEHSRADVNISYALNISSALVLPGTTKDLQVPGEYTLRVPRTSVVRLRTEGTTDVRCRIFNAAGVLVTEATDNGADWNCALAEPLPGGDYRVVLESQTLTAGTTRLSVSLPKLEEMPAFTDGKDFKVASNVVTVAIPPVTGDTVQELVLRSSSRFSCAVEDAAGVLQRRDTDVKECVLMFRHAQAMKVRVWTLEGSATVKVQSAVKSIATWSGSIPGGSAARGTLQRAGLFKTAPNIWCLPDATRGLLRRCAGEVSLEAGTVVMATPGKDTAPLSLTENLASTSRAQSQRLSLGSAPFIQRMSASVPSVFLTRVQVPPGEKAGPACSLEKGVREMRDDACFAVSGLSSDATVRLWTNSGELPGQWTRSAVAPAPASTQVAPGRQSVTWEGTSTRLAMPARAFRLDLVVPQGSWVVQLDGSNNAVDLCAPQEKMARCQLNGQGGEVWVSSENAGRADLTLVQVDAPVRTLTLATLLEERAREAGTLRLKVAPAATARVVTVEGAQRCVVRLDDGSRVAACSAPVPANLGATLEVDHDVGPVRAVLHAADGLVKARAGSVAAGKAQPLGVATAVALAPATERTLTLTQEAVVHVRADSGVCTLLRGDELLDSAGMDGCEMHRLLAPGTYRLVMRAFGKEPLVGTLSWTQDGVEELKDGVGPERWLAPGDVRIFRFKTASAGRVGLGMQLPSETVACTIRDVQNRVLGEGCQQYVALEPGTYLLTVAAPPLSNATWFKPVVLGLAGAKMDVPEAYVRDFFNRVGSPQ